MVKLSQFRCQVLNTAGLWPEKAQAQNHSPAPGRSDLKHPCLQSSEQTLCKSTLRSKPRVQRHRAGLPGSRDTGLPGSQTRHSARSPPQLSPCRTAQPGTCPQLKLSMLQGGTRDLGVFLDRISCFMLLPVSFLLVSQ